MSLVRMRRNAVSLLLLLPLMQHLGAHEKNIYCNAQQQQQQQQQPPQQEEEIALGADCSWPMHKFPIRHPDRDEQHRIAQRYIDYMGGCFDHYSEAECRTSDKERMAMNLYQTQAMQNYTAAGYAKLKAPAAVMDILQDFYKEHRGKNIRESWPPGSIYINHWKSDTKMLPLDGLSGDTSYSDKSAASKQQQQPSLPVTQRQDIIAQIQSILETWTKVPLLPSSLYGIRIYRRGAILAPHVDRLPLVISAIINVAQNVDEPWPLELIGHDGKAVNVTMEPGDLVLYEGASVIHGRPYPLAGHTYANVFLHFEPVGHTERHMNLRKDPKVLFDQALKKQQSHEERTSKDKQHHSSQSKQHDKKLPYYVSQEKEEQWKQEYVFVKRPVQEKPKEKKGISKDVKQGKDDPRHFHNLAAVGDLKQMQAMARQDPDVVTKKDSNGWTALHEAARAGNTAIVEWLCSLMDQETINYRTNNGMGASALWWAMHMNDENHPVVQTLIRHGARSIAPKV